MSSFLGPGSMIINQRLRVKARMPVHSYITYSPLTQSVRFTDVIDINPSPGFYDAPDSGLIKRTFNVGLIDWKAAAIY